MWLAEGNCLMSKRSVAAVVVLNLITFGLYGIYWYIATKDEMVSQGADIPTGWLLIVPIANIYWMWKWSQGVEHVSRGKTSAGVAVLMLFLLHLIGMAIVQSTFNQIASEQQAGGLPRARIA